ncbi:hypothetical protein BC827DRAFT_1273622 [Russula dissimulans]|nr:hypothetical protein BC827DRAFT_1273622 [Russula dissimulans]
MNKSNVADRLSYIDDEGIEWTKATSKNGVPYEVGIQKSKVKDHREDFTQAADPFFHINVRWPVRIGDDKWKWTVGELNRDWISRYKVHDNQPSTIYDYRLDITSKTSRAVAYFFTDESDDYYTIKALYAGDHYVRYNSKKPTIVRMDVLT